MFTIRHKGPDGPPRSESWYINQDKPRIPDDHTMTELSADGHELDYIRIWFVNIPDRTNRQLTLWKDSIAQFLYDNL